MPGAALAAVESNFAIECDIQLTVDGEAMVHHDDELGRLTEGAGDLAKLSADALKQVSFKDTPERMMSLVLLGDLVSLYLAVLREVDPTPVPMLDRVKSALSRG